VFQADVAMTEENLASRAFRFEPLSALWRFLALPQTLMVLMTLLALALILGSVIPQASPQVGSEPQALLVAQRGFLGQRDGLLRALGFFDLYHAFWFHLLLALVGLCLFVRLVESAEVAWRATIRKRWTASAFALWGHHAPRDEISAALPPDDVQSRVYDALAQHSYRWVDVPGLALPNTVVGRREYGLWAKPVAYGALLVGLIGLVILGTWGWQIEDQQFAPGESRSVGHGRVLAVRLDDFRLQEGQAGRSPGYRSEITWLDGEVVQGQAAVAAGQPASYRGVTVRQVGYVPTVKMRAWDDAGRLLALQTAGEEFGIPGELEVGFLEPEAQPLILVPSQDRFLVLKFQRDCEDGNPSLHVALVRNGGVDQQSLGTLRESGVLLTDGLRLELDLGYTPILRVDYRPATGLVVASMALAVVALTVGWLVPGRLAWIAVQPSKDGSTTVQILIPAGARGRRWLSRLADQLGEALASDD
jgi:hypothetical protein